MFYRTLASLSLLASVPLNATEIDDLVNTSQSIRDTFAYGIKTIAGGAAYAGEGSIAPAMAENGHISKDQQDAYNAAVAAVKRPPTVTTPAQTNTFKTKLIKPWITCHK